MAAGPTCPKPLPALDQARDATEDPVEEGRLGDAERIGQAERHDDRRHAGRRHEDEALERAARGAHELFRLARVPHPVPAMEKGALEVTASTAPGWVTWKQANRQALPEPPEMPTEASGRAAPFRVMDRVVSRAAPGGMDRANWARYIPGRRSVICPPSFRKAPGVPCWMAVRGSAPPAADTVNPSSWA